MSRTEEIIKGLTSAMSGADRKKQSSYDTPATVTRIEGNTAWVHINGGISETPVKLTINAKIGDTVQVRVGGGTAWLVGNQTAPPTDDTKAIEAKEEAVRAGKTATDFVADTDNGLFVHPRDNMDDGVRITDAIEIIKSNLSFFKAWIDGELARVRVGREDAGHTDIDSNGLRVFGGNGSNQLANIGYGEGNAQDGGTATEPYYTLGTRYIGQGEQVGNFSVAEGENVEARGYTAHGEGHETQAIGAMSHAEGSYSVSSGTASHAEGQNTMATGTASHAEGSGGNASGNYSHTEGVGCTATKQGAHAGGSGSVASGENSFAHGENVQATGNGNAAFGAYNAYNTNYAFAVGNGDATTRKNAFTVGKSGNAYFEGRMMSGSLEDGSSSHAMFVKGSKSDTSESVASGGTNRVKIDITSEGYIPVAIGGVQLTNSAFTFYTAIPITEADPSGNKHYAIVNVKNNGSSAATTNINLIVFYIASSAL